MTSAPPPTHWACTWASCAARPSWTGSHVCCTPSAASATCCARAHELPLAHHAGLGRGGGDRDPVHVAAQPHAHRKRAAQPDRLSAAEQRTRRAAAARAAQAPRSALRDHPGQPPHHRLPAARRRRRDGDRALCARDDAADHRRHAAAGQTRRGTFLPQRARERHPPARAHGAVRSRPCDRVRPAADRNGQAAEQAAAGAGARWARRHRPGGPVRRHGRRCGRATAQTPHQGGRACRRDAGSERTDRAHRRGRDRAPCGELQRDARRAGAIHERARRLRTRAAPAGRRRLARAAHARHQPAHEHRDPPAGRKHGRRRAPAPPGRRRAADRGAHAADDRPDRPGPWRGAAGERRGRARGRAGGRGRGGGPPTLTVDPVPARSAAHDRHRPGPGASSVPSAT
jgi:hypothetical protein